jgi:hypothetical protein
MRKSMGKILGTHPQPRVCGSIFFALAPRNPTLPRKEEPFNRSTASRSFRHAPSAADSSLTCGALEKASISFPTTHHVQFIRFAVFAQDRVFSRTAKEANPHISLTFYLPFPYLNMLWKYSLNWSGFIEAPSSLSEARKFLIMKIATDPASVISKLEPAEPTPHTLVDLGKRVFGVS